MHCLGLKSTVFDQVIKDNKKADMSETFHFVIPRRKYQLPYFHSGSSLR